MPTSKQAKSGCRLIVQFSREEYAEVLRMAHARGLSNRSALIRHMLGFPVYRQRQRRDMEEEKKA